MINPIALIAKTPVMASIRIRNLEPSLKRRLRIRAANRNHSMEDEARDILRAALAEQTPPATNLFDAIRRRIGPRGGVELRIPPRGPMREPPDFA